MTLVVSIKHEEGIIIGSDSQATLNRGVSLKKLNQMKLFKIKTVRNKIIIGGAGSVPFISKSLEEIQDEINLNPNLSFSEVISIAEKAVLHVARWYGFDRAKEMIPGVELVKPPVVIEKKDENEEAKRDVVKHESSQQTLEIKPVDVILMIVGIDEKDESQIYIIYPEGIAEKQQCEAAIGSGAAYAEYVLSKLSGKDIGADRASKIIAQTIDEVKDIDPGVGGITQIINISKNQIEEYDEEKVNNLTEEVQHMQYFIRGVWEDYFKGEFNPKKDIEVAEEISVKDEIEPHESSQSDIGFGSSDIERDF